MLRLRVVVDENETGIACDLEWIPRTANIEEGRQTSKRGRMTMDATRFNQFGRWRATIRYDGRTLPVDPKRSYGTKDRSWGDPAGRRAGSRRRAAAAASAGVLPLGAAPVGRPLHAHGLLRARRRPHVALGRR